MLQENNIELRVKCQQYQAERYWVSLDEKESVILFESKQRTEDVRCPVCGSHVNIHSMKTINLKDMSIWVGCKQELRFIRRRYRCMACSKTFTEEIPLRYPGTRITTRAARWVQTLLQNKITVRSVQDITGIHWDTIRKIQTEMIEKTLTQRQQERSALGYKPRFLAVDEFAIHKGHTYATCVMDLDTGEVLWVGKGRAKADFARFFEETDADFLSDVVAVAMDMNASYHLLIQQYLPHAQIVYDRYHMQAQYGKEVLGVVRLTEARKHKQKAASIKACIASAPDVASSRKLKSDAKAEQQLYSKLKGLRWALLTNREKLSEHGAQQLSSILEAHSQLAVCYAMKEELCRLFSLRDAASALVGWQRWFSAALNSNIPALVAFAQRKQSRIEGLIAHALFPISTGKLEGFNNKIKVAKRIGYGYRDDAFFFALVRFLSIPLAPYHSNP